MRILYLDKSLVGKVNSWEYYFKQPSDYTLDEVCKSKNVILSYGFASSTGTPRSLYARLEKDPSFISEAEKIPLSDAMQKAINEEYEKLFPKNGKVLGVSSRGTDMVNFVGHSKLPDAQQLIKITQEKLQEFCCDYVFLATEEQSVIDQFKEAFGDQLIVDNRMRYDSFKNSDKAALPDMHFDRENDAYLNGKEYLTTVSLLSKCDCLLGTIIGSTLGAICMNGNKYENIEILDFGTY